MGPGNGHVLNKEGVHMEREEFQWVTATVLQVVHDDGEEYDDDCKDYGD